MEYGCIGTKCGMNSKVVARIYAILTHNENLSIREEMDTKTRIYTRTTKIDEVNIIADFRAPRYTRFTSLKSDAYIYIAPYIRLYFPCVFYFAELFNRAFIAHQCPISFRVDRAYTRLNPYF